MKLEPKFPQIPETKTLLKENFLTGILVLIPFAVCAWILGKILSALWSFRTFIPEDLRPDHWISNPSLLFLVNLGVVIIISLTLAFAVSFLGWTSKNYLGKKFFEWLGHVILRIPVLRSIYGGLDQLIKTMTAGGKQQFSRVVYVEYPRAGMWSLAFVTSSVKSKILSQDKVFLNLFIPTTPNPTSGFHLMVEENQVKDSHLSVEEAFKTLLSLGIAQNGKE